MRILENYVKFYLLKESINMEDSKKIQQYVKKLDSSLKSVGLDLSNLNFNYLTIAGLRDANKVIKTNKEMSGQNISYTDKEILQLGLGFNLINSLSESDWQKKDGIHKIKIVKLINLLKKTNKNRPMFDAIEKIQVLEDTLTLKKAIDNAGLKLLGAGLYRAVLQIPGVEGVVLKIALSEKGRKDSRAEIEFSKGTGASRLEHVKNFPTVYDHSNDGSWFAIEKVLLISKNILNAKDPKHKKLSMEVARDLKQQFPVTFKFLSDVHVNLKQASKNAMINVKNIGSSDSDLLQLFSTYLSAIFHKRTEFSAAHASVLDKAVKKTTPENLYKRKTTPENKPEDMSVRIPYGYSSDLTLEHSLLAEFYNSLLNERSSPESVVSTKIINKKLHIFLSYIVKKYIHQNKIEMLKDTVVKLDSDLSNANTDPKNYKDSDLSSANTIDPVNSKIAQASSSYTNNSINDLVDFLYKNSLSKDIISKMLNEVSSMFDQAVVTNITDLHLGNMGFKKNENDKWQLIFTDIDVGN
jgi:hypothetical protein